ncbi:MAG: ATP-binding protein, partial [Calditrichia bacterium]
LEWQQKDLLTVSIETRNKTMGYLVVHDPVDRLKPTLEKVIPLEFYANQAAVAVENAILFEQLQDSEERYRFLAETMSLGLVTCDLNCDVLYANTAFEKLTHLKLKDILKRKLPTFFNEKSHEKLRNIVDHFRDETTERLGNVENIELELMKNGDEAIPVSISAFPYYQRREKVGFFIVVNDLRLVKRLERIKADFNSMVVHDLRSPMNVIQGFIELIRNEVVGQINAEQEELLDIARENVKKVLTLVDNFLVASKIEVGRFNIDPKLNEINALIERIVENHRVLISNKSIKLSANLDRNLPLLFFDSLRIEQVINNLLSNAMKFTGENGRITINTELLKKQIKGEDKFYSAISVEDEGGGIPPEKIDTIFEKYEQVDSDSGMSVAGTGLGLAICKEIVHLHGGEIWVTSEVGKGSKFTFTLPIEPSLEKIIS